ncbi:ferrochelatase [Nakamurella lactea]|uniref:ferrochelatase n=1 Tax=Nakamurella lactea TaxID=459515 RepID=UPI000406281D|nr:ferrochelatase [Nakamurella lactea]
MSGPEAAAAATVSAASEFPYDAVLLAGFGGPEKPADVLPFLRNVTAARGVPEERLAEVGRHYEALGGVSPINEQTDALRTALQTELVDRGIALPVLWGNRNWNPYLIDTLREARDSGRHRLLAVTTSAYSSYSSCRQYRENFAAALIETDALGTVSIDKVRPYFDQPGFLDPFADGVAQALREALAGGLTADEVQIIFTTHSIPTAMADTSGSATLGEHGNGGAYVAQHLAAARYVAEQVADRVPHLGGELNWQLAYQSRSGSPSTPWLEPDVNDVLAEQAAAGARGVIVVPIGFVSDHVEVIWDLDREAADTAGDLGLRFWRVPTPGTDPRFVSALADLIAGRVGRGLPHEAVLDLPARPLACAPGCCANPRGVRPTTSGQDSADDVAVAGGASR